MRRVQRHFADVGGRRVHYRRAGAGPPLLLIHGSPGNSLMLTAEIDALAAHYDCIAPDTPGFGLSDALFPDHVTVADLAAAIAATITSLELPPCRVYGTHTGAAIALELGACHPELVSGLVLDGVPIFTPYELAQLFEGYFAPLVVDGLAGHLTTTWMRFRDQFTWFPWTARDNRRLNPIDRPQPEQIDQWVSMFYEAAGSYSGAYRAAVHYGQGAIQAASALTRPAVFMASPEDMLFPHLERLPPLRSGQRIATLPRDPAEQCGALAAALATLPGEGVALARSHGLAGHDPAMGFVAAEHGDVLIRAFGDEDRPAVMLLHDAPGSGEDLAPLAGSLAARFRVIVPDLPGAADSALAGHAEDPIGTAAAALSAAADALRLDRFSLFGRGAGAAVAARLAAVEPRVCAAWLDGLPLPDPIVAVRIAPEIMLDAEGGHWLRAWLMLRDGEIYWPWYDGTVASQRATPGDFDAARLHARTVALMKARTRYHHLPRAAFTRNPLPDLGAAHGIVRLGAGVHNPLRANDAALPHLAAPPLPADIQEQAEVLTAFLLQTA